MVMNSGVIMAYLERIQIKGFKSIREMDLKLKPLNVLIGANGAGKSNFIGAFRLLNMIIERRLQAYSLNVGADTLLHYGRKVTEYIEIQLTFQPNNNPRSINGYQARLTSSQANTLIFEAEQGWYKNRQSSQKTRSLKLGNGHSETNLHDSRRESYIAQYVADSLASWQIYHFHDTSETAKVKFPQSINDNAYLRADASNLAPFLYLMSERRRDYYDRIVKSIRLVAPFFDDFTLRPNPLNPNSIQLEWREKNSDAYFNAHSLSDGTLRFMCLATLLLQPTLPSMILIDEPELGLHPYAIVLLAELLRSAATQTQVIVSTQSVPLVNQFDPEEVVVVDRKDGQSTFNRLELAPLEGWLEDYGLGDLWEKNVIGGRPQPAIYSQAVGEHS